MKFRKISPEEELDKIIDILNNSHLTIAEEFGFTRENNPSNNAFIDANTLRSQLTKGIELFTAESEDKQVGCIAIEKSANQSGTFYIEKVSVLPEARHNGYGEKIMKFAEDKIKDKRGKKVSLALIDKNYRLKHWYEQLGYSETGTRDFPHLPFLVCFMEKEL